MSGSGSLVGRDRMVAVLQTAIGRARAGQGSVVLVTGEPGIGKTALVAHVAAVAAADGMPVAWGRGAEGTGSPAYWPWTQVLRGLDALAADEHLGAGESVGGDDDRFRLFDRTIGLLEERGREGGLVVVLDDLHWADADSLRLLEFVARQLAGRRIALLGTYRDTESDAQLRRAAGAAEIVRLDGLPAADVGAVMASITGSAVADDDAARLHARTCGNPLFVRELCRLAHARGLGIESWGGAGVVDSVREVIERRIARLSEPCTRMLGLAALDGAVVRAGLLARVLGDDVDLVALVDEAVAARVLVDDDGVPRFVHDLFREVLDAGAFGAARRDAHLAIGRAMESARADGEGVHPVELAAHFSAAGAAERAVRYCREAADEAAGRLAFDDAVAHLERAAVVLDTSIPEPGMRLAVVLDLAAAYLSAGRPADAATSYRKADVIARQVGDVEAQAHGAIGLHRVGLKTGPSPERDAAAAQLEAAADALGADGGPLLAHLRAALARTLTHSMEVASMARARAIAEDAVALARTCGDPDAIVDGLLAWHDACWEPGRAAPRLAILDELDHLDALDRVNRSHVQLLRAQALLERGDPASRQLLDDVCAAAERAGTPTARWLARSRQSAAALLSGRVDEADELLRQAERLAEMTGQADGAWIADIQRWELARFTGGRATYARRHPDSEPPVERWAPWRAVVLADAGDHDAAAAAMAGFTAGQAHGPGVDAGYDLWFPSIAAEAAARCGSEQLRRDLYDLLSPFAGTHVGCGAFVAYAGPVDHHLAVLAGALGHADAAAAHRNAAVEQCRRLGAPRWVELVGERPEPPTGDRFRRTGPVWAVSFGGVDALVPDSKGLHDIAALLARPAQPVPATQLAGTHAASRGDPALDRRALAAYRSRLRDLDDDIDHADTDHDTERAARARLERDALLDELRRSTGRGGQPRRLGDDTEKARKTVTARIHRALRAVEDHHPALATHLRASIETGTTCRYAPPNPVDWNL